MESDSDLQDPEIQRKIKKYERAKRPDLDTVKTRNFRIESRKADQKIQKSLKQALKNELLLPEEPGHIVLDENENTCISQETIVANSDITSAAKRFTLSLTEFGPYKINFSRNGRHLLLAGRRGHVAALDWVTKTLNCEMNVMESVHDICYLHIPTMFAAAQKKWVYIYDEKGIELHCLKKLPSVLQMEFLPYHFLLVTSNEAGFLAWLDVCIGKIVKQTFTKEGRLDIMCQNPYNAVVATGHRNGTVNMWSPNEEKPLVQLLCHKRPIRAIAIDPKGLYLATASMDRTVNIFDVRTYKSLQSYQIRTTPEFLTFSQRDSLALGTGNKVEVYNDCCRRTVEKPYLKHLVKTNVSDLQFCPYEDVLGIGSAGGFDSMLVPGAGEPNFDAYECNPFMNKQQMEEMEVKALLEKIQPELITLDPRKLGRYEPKEEKPKAMPTKPQEIRFRKKKSKSSVDIMKTTSILKDKAKRDFIKKSMKHETEMKEKYETQMKEKTEFMPYSVMDRFKPKRS